MARIAALVFATALLCAGCGSVEGERTTTKGVTISRADGSALVSHAAERRGSWSMMAFVDTGEPADEGAPLAQSLEAMSEPRTPADDLPDWATGMLDGIGQAPGYDPGTPLEAKSR